MILEKKRKLVIEQCDCSCSFVVVEKFKWNDGEVNFNVTINDSNYSRIGIRERFKGFFNILCNKPIYYSDLLIRSDEAFQNWLDELKELVED